MLISYSGLVMYSPDLKSKIIGVLLILVNALVFHK